MVWYARTFGCNCSVLFFFTDLYYYRSVVNRTLILNNSLHIEILRVVFIFSAMYPVLEVEGGVEQHGGEAPTSPRPVTPQTPNTPLSPQGEELPQPQPLLDFDAQLPTSASQVCLSV